MLKHKIGFLKDFDILLRNSPQKTESSHYPLLQLYALFFLLSVLGFLIKVYFLAATEHNTDMVSFRIVSKLMYSGGNVYTDTTRYNYGPIWAYVLAFLRYIQLQFFDPFYPTFHMLVASFLSLADIAIAFILARCFSYVAALFFLLNPVSVLMIGCHSQFDNLAVLLGLTGIIVLPEDGDSKISTKQVWLCAFFIGISLIMKHILFIFPLWLAINSRFSLRQRFILLFFPFFLFAAGFLPFCFNHASLSGIINNVFLYQSAHLNAFFPHLVELFVPIKFIETYLERLPLFNGFRFIWLVAMLCSGYLLRYRHQRELYLFYLIGLCVLSSAIADQYLAIPVAACAVFWRSKLCWGYIMTATIYLLSSPNNLNINPQVPILGGIVAAFRETGYGSWQPLSFLFIFFIMALLVNNGIRPKH